MLFRCDTVLIWPLTFGITLACTVAVAMVVGSRCRCDSKIGECSPKIAGIAGLSGYFWGTPLYRLKFFDSNTWDAFLDQT